jgi:hypothetical protein
MKVSLNLADRMSRTVTVLAERLDMPMAEVVREALSLYWWLAKERSTGTRISIHRGEEVTEMVIPSLDGLIDGAPLEDPPE